MAQRHWSFMMPPLEHGFIRWLDDVYRGWFTPAGRAMFWGAAAGGLLLLGGVLLTQVVFAAWCAAVLLSAAVAGAFFRPTVRMRRILPPPASVGEVLEYRVAVTNTGARTLRRIFVEERGLPSDLRPVGEAAEVPELKPGQTAEVKLRLACNARGQYQLRKLQAASVFPSGLVKWPRFERTADRLLVYPRFHKVEGFEIPAGRNYQPGGIPVASHIGESTEFFGTREWRDGDRLRDIHWPSSARTGKLVVKEFQEEYFVRLALVLDAEAKKAKDEVRFEKSLSLAAGLADVLARRDFIVDIFAAGPQIFQFQAGRALAHVDNILEILASLETGDEIDVNALEAALVPEASKLSAVLFVVMGWDERRAQLVQLLQQHGVTVRVMAIGDKSMPRVTAVDEYVEVA